MVNPATDSDRRYDAASITFPERRTETRRRFRRFLISLPVSCRDRAYLSESYSLDIGLGGIGLFTEQLKPLGSELLLQFSFSPDLYVEFHSEVIHAAESTDLRRQATVGLQFIRGTDTERKALASYLAGVANMAIPPQPNWVPGLVWHRSEYLTDRVIHMSGTQDPGALPTMEWPWGWERQVHAEFVRAAIPDAFSAGGLRLSTVEATIHHGTGLQDQSTVRLRIKVTGIKRATMTTRFEYLHPDTQQIISEGQQVFAFMNPQGRMIPIPSDFLAAYQRRYI